MMEKKNIDRLFQEKFKDFEATPDESAWEFIKGSQQQRGKKRILPLWFRIAGSAAALALLLGLGLYLINSTPILQNQLVIQEDVKKSSPEKIQNSDEKNSLITTNEVDKLLNTNTKEITLSPKKKETGSGISNHNSESMITEEQKVELSSSKNEKIAGQNFQNVKRIAVKEENQNEKSFQGNESGEFRKNLSSEAVSSKLPDNKINQNESLTQVDKKPSIEVKDSITDNNFSREKISILEAVAASNDAKKIKSGKNRKWSIAPNIAPVYYNTLSSGSGIDAQFVDNTKQGQVNMSYGVQVAYAISPKLKIRSGVNRVDLSYGTEEVGFSAFSSGPTLANVSYNERSKAILINDFRNKPSAPAGNEVQSDLKAFVVQNEGILYQELGYFEVPMELSYHIIDTKFGLELIGGMSTLFLEDSNLSINAGDFTTDIGESTNINTVSFTGNIGLGFGYQISERFSVNVQPLFKYQVNAFQNSSGDFTPFFFGIYSGITLKL